MAKSSDKVGGESNNSFFRKIALGAGTLAACAALLAGLGIENMVDTPSPKKSDEGIVLKDEEMEKIVAAVTNNYSDLVEFQTGYGVSESTITWFDASKDSLTIIGTSVFNMKGFPSITTCTTLTSEQWKVFHDGKYQTFLTKCDENTATSTDVVNIVSDSAEFITPENVVSFTKLDILNNDRIQTILKSVVSNYVNTSETLSDTEKQEMSTSLVTDSEKLALNQAGYARRTYDDNKRIFGYIFSAQFVYNGYVFNVNCNIENNTQIKKDQFVDVLENEYKNNTELFEVVVTKAPEITKVFYNQKANNTSVDAEPETEIE